MRTIAFQTRSRYPQWKKELQQLAQQRRYEAEQLKQKMEGYSKKENDRRNRLLLIHCVEKAQAMLTEQTANGIDAERLTNSL